MAATDSRRRYALPQPWGPRHPASLRRTDLGAARPHERKDHRLVSRFSRTYAATLATVAAVVTLTACGGGGHKTVAQAPSPTPTVTPTPKPKPPPNVSPL